jgi:tRNA (pseudouridine54-N1)-methyltransferase
MRRFVIVAQKARASADFLLVDIPSTSGRLDVLLRCLRAALLVSHGVRRDTIVYLVLLGDPERPVTLRIEGSASRYLRPDERSLATVIKKALALPPATAAFSQVRAGIMIAEGGIETFERELADSKVYLLDEAGEDLRESLPTARESLPTPTDVTFFLGDHIGLDPHALARIHAFGARALCVGPLSLHSEDVITLVHNELDRRTA